jgi:formylglycine-generating enzyme required for sulfatase activity
MKHAITKTPSAPRPTQPTSPGADRGSRRWIVAFGLVLGFGTLAVGGALVWQHVSDNTPPEGMIRIPAGEFWMGDKRFPESQPLHKVQVDEFWMDRTEVTNGQFRKFVEATGYKTVAERQPTAEQYPGAKSEDLVPGSGVFSPPKECTTAECEECMRTGDCNRWWKYVHGASWRHPRGPETSVDGKDDYPVVHIAWEDAVAYCKWASKRLPTEAEWEYAARGGLDRKPYYWGDEKKPGGKHMANTWQGKFPLEDTGEDGFCGLAPVGSFPPNGYGLHDMAGNAWEWCSDWFRPDAYQLFATDFAGVRNPQGPKFSHNERGVAEPLRVTRGGSFLCADNYCIRYLAGARHHGAPDTGLEHNGFRCVWQPGLRKGQ